MDIPRASGSARRSADEDSLPAQLVEELYDHLKMQAVRYMQRQPRNHTLQPTALVHEAYVRMFRGNEAAWTSAEHFLAVAARVMINVLVDHARGKDRLKRRAPGQRVPVEAVLVHFENQHVDIIDLQDQLASLENGGQDGRRLATVVRLRAFGGLTMAEIADQLNLSKRTVERDFRFARAHLYSALGIGNDTPS